MLGFVLLVMVGGLIHDFQEPLWLGATPLSWPIPLWLGVWFSVFPTAEGIAAQVVAASSFRIGRRRPRAVAT